MYEKATELAEIAEAVIETYKQRFESLEDCRIAFLWCDKAKTSNGNKVYADTSKISDKINVICDYDFIITFYKPWCEDLSTKAKHRLMYHELRHVGYDAGKCRIIPHDVNDFRELIEAGGLDWIDVEDE